MSNRPKRTCSQSTSTSPLIQARPSKRQVTEDANSADHVDDTPNGQPRFSGQTSFDGVGLQISGSSNVRVGGNLHIGASNAPKCLADLRLTDPGDDKKRIEASKGGLLQDSYRWVLDSHEFLSWRDDPVNRVLWVRGDPGKGKTMLVCGIIDELRKTAHGAPPAFFFCQATDSRLNSATAVLRGLIYVLVNQQKHLIPHLRQKHDDAGKNLFHDVNAWFALSGILDCILEDPTLQETCFVVDALDECEFDRDLLLDLITRKCGLSRVKWVISSRDFPDIEKKLNRTTGKVEISLERNLPSLTDAVHHYICTKVEALNHEKDYTPEIRDAVTEYLLLNANNTFLWVALVCQDLAHVEAWRALEKIKTLPSGLDSLYSRMMDQVRGLPDAQLCKQILAVATIVYRPISLLELYHILDLPAGFPKNEIFLKKLVDLCGCFVNLRESAIYFVHQSAKDFLSSKAAGELYPAGIYQEHHSIYSKSIRFMSSTLKRDIYNLRDPGSAIGKVQKPTPDPLGSSKYSCLYWVDHLCDSMMDKTATTPVSHGELISQFLKKSFLYWLEALSLIGSLSYGVSSLLKLLDMMQTNQRDTEATSLARDACRFIRYHKECIETYPLQTYISALIFSPDKSLIRTAHSHEEPGWILIQPTMEDCWSPGLQTFECRARAVTSLAYSSDSRFVASSSWDAPIKVWDANTGALAKMLSPRETSGGTIVSFSRHGNLLSSSIYGDVLLKNWDTATGRCIKLFEDSFEEEQNASSFHGGESVFSSEKKTSAFSHDGRILAIVYSDSAVRTYSVATGDLKRSFPGVGGPRCGDPPNLLCDHSIALSRDGSLVAAELHGPVIRINNTDTGSCIQTLRKNSRYKTPMAFSPDARMLATGWDDDNLKLWDVATGDLAFTFQGHERRVSSVAFSENGFMIATGSDDSTVKIWNVATRTCTHTFRGHIHRVTSLAFSPNSCVLASACSNGGDIRIWDTNTAAPTHDQLSNVTAVCCSENGQTIAVVYKDHSFKVLDSATGRCLRTTKTGDRFAALFAISPGEGRFLAFGSLLGKISIWDSFTSTSILDTQAHHDKVSSLAFETPSILASKCSGGTIKLWDADTGICSQTLEVERSHIGCMAFSHQTRMLAWTACHAGGDVKLIHVNEDTDAQPLVLKAHREVISSSELGFSPASDGGQMLASSYNDKTVTVWDIATGARVLRLAFDGLTGRPWFEEKHLLRTKIGNIDLSHYQLDMNLDRSSESQPKPSEVSIKPQKASIHGFGISHWRWITWNDRRILWLPVDHEPWKSCISDTGVAIVNRQRRVLVFKFDTAQLSRIFDGHT